MRFCHEKNKDQRDSFGQNWCKTKPHSRMKTLAEQATLRQKISHFSSGL